MQLRLHWPLISSNFICTGNVSQILALLLTRKRRYNLVQNIALEIYKCITKSNLQEARAEIFLFDFFFLIRTIFHTYLLLSYLCPRQICFQKARTEEWVLTSAAHSVTLHGTGRNCCRLILVFLTYIADSHEMTASNIYAIEEIIVSHNSSSKIVSCYTESIELMQGHTELTLETQK